jgi:hypothetical protein
VGVGLHCGVFAARVRAAPSADVIIDILDFML